MRKTNLYLILGLAILMPFLSKAQEEEKQIYTLNEQWVDCGDGVQLSDPYFEKGVTFVWEGPSKNGKAHGKGTAKRYVNGVLESTYVGEYKDGVREGKGTVTTYRGTVQTGTFSKGQLIGKGKIEWENGDVYEGNIVNYHVHGPGKVKKGSGEIFEGVFYMNNPFTGKFTYLDGSELYIQEGEPVDEIDETKVKYNPKKGKKLTEYFDDEWKRTEAKDAEYYRIITYDAPNIPKGVVKDYYMNGILQGEAAFAYLDYDDEVMNFNEGRFAMYYPNGILEKEIFFYNNYPNGPATTFYNNGALAELRYFTHGIPEREITYYPSGNIASLSLYENGELKDDTYYTFDEDGEYGYMVYSEDFVKNEKYWASNGPNGQVFPLQENILALSVTPYRTLGGSIYTGFDDNIIEFTTYTIDPSKDVMIGALVGFKDWYNYCGFFISGNQFAYQEVVDGKTMVDSGWKFSSAIDDQINIIEISNFDDELSFSINEVEVGSIKRPDYQGDYFVPVVKNNGDEVAEVAFVDLTVRIGVENPLGKESYIPAMPSIVQNDDSWKAFGSGFFIDENGLLATNYHVVEGMNEIEVTFTRNNVDESYPAKVVSSDKENDLSILKIESADFTPMGAIPYNFMFKVQDTGSEIFTLGYPMITEMGEEIKFTDGKISSKTGFRGDIRTYQISAPIQHGNSGGPLFDINGNLIGITSSGLSGGPYNPQNVNYAIKASYLKELIETLPERVQLQTHADLTNLSLPEKIKAIAPYVIRIKVK